VVLERRLQSGFSLLRSGRRVGSFEVLQRLIWSGPISLDQAASARTSSLLPSYLHANGLRFWIAVKTTFAVVLFRKRSTTTLLSPISVP
jgi:hypothetical protein